MATVKNSEPNAVGPQEPSMPKPQELPTVPEAGTMSAESRSRRLQRNMARLFRGMANTAPQRGDSLGPLWHECACDAEALCKEAGNVDEKPATPERPLELRPTPEPVSSMLHGAPGVDPLQLQTLQALQQLGAGMAALIDKVDKLK